MRKVTKQSWFRRHRLLALLIAIVVIILVLLGLYLKHKHDEKFIKPTIINTTTPTNTGSSNKTVIGGTGTGTNTNTSTSTGGDTSGKTSTGTSGTTTTTSGTPPQAPNGAFVSNHKPGQNGSPFAEESTCNVQPGVTCTISFTNGSTTKSLQSQVAGSNGSVAWSWSPAGLGLTSGNWTVTAAASLNGVSASTTDQTPLEVQ